MCLTHLGLHVPRAQALTALATWQALLSRQTWNRSPVRGAHCTRPVPGPWLRGPLWVASGPLPRAKVTSSTQNKTEFLPKYVAANVLFLLEAVGSIVRVEPQSTHQVLGHCFQEEAATSSSRQATPFGSAGGSNFRKCLECPPRPFLGFQTSGLTVRNRSPKCKCPQGSGRALGKSQGLWY